MMIILIKKKIKYEPQLFSKSAPPGYTSYSTNCQWNNRRQPVLVTDKELKKIDEIDKEEGTKSYNGVLRYKSKSSKDGEPYNYICPRFWCIKDPKKIGGKDMSNKPLSIQQVDEGKCGGWNAVMRDNKKKVPKDKYIFEFSDTRMHRAGQKMPHYDEKGGDAKKIAYRPMYPNFANPKKIVPGLCAPCCQRMPAQGIKIELDPRKRYYFEPDKHKELQKRKEDWMKKEGEEWKIDFEKLEKMDEFKNKYPKNHYITKKPCINDINCYKPINKSNPLACKNQKEGEGDRSRSDDAPPAENDNIEDKPSYNFPLGKNQLGYMNVYLQDFLNFDNKSICYKSKDPADNEGRKLKDGTFCLLRLGIEKNIKQSFLYLLSNVYEFYDENKSEGKNLLPTKNINNFKEDFIKNLTIDKFVSAQNGILTKLFVKNTDDIDDEKINKYDDSKYFDNITEKKIKRQLISAYENFIKFIKDENEEIDYKYIWDLVCKPMNNGGVLFKDGINLLIFKETNNDMTFNKIEIICPMNYYSSNFFDDKKKTLMVVTNGDFYEPLCSVKKNKNEKPKWIINRFFSPVYRDNDKKIVRKGWDYEAWEGVKLFKTIELIKENLTKYCMAKPSVRNEKYNYNSNISFMELKDKLKANKIRLTQIFNSNNKIVGGLYKFDEINKKYIYIPTEPSPIDTSIEMKYINDVQEFYLDYKTTKDELEKLKERGIPCKPVSKILENGLIVGIKTETNQFVPVLPEENNEAEDDIKTEETYIKNEYQLDEYIINNNTRDDEMLKVVKAIKLENNFYTMFRNTLKIMLSDKKYNEKKEEIKNIANDKTKSYIENFQILRNKLIELLSTAIEFIETELDTIEDYKDLISCFGLDSDSCRSEGQEKVGCFLRKNVCSLILPKINLFNSMDNEDLYYNKLTDELLRFQKIKNYIFTEREYLSFDSVNYRVNDNEIILLEGILLNTYLNKNLKLSKSSEYIENKSIYELIPAQNGFDLITDVNWNKKRNIIINNEGESKGEGESKREKWISTDCENEILDQKIKTKLNKVLLTESNMKLYEYNYGKCKFVLLEKIIKNHIMDTGEDVSIDIIKNRLIEEHKKLQMPDHNINSKGNEHSLLKGYVTKRGDKLCKVISLLYAVKKEDVKFKEIEKEINTDEEKNEIIKNDIMRDEYNISDFEIFLILKSYNVPALIISSGPLNSTILNKNEKIFNTDIDSDEYYVIVNRKIKNEKKKKVCLYTHNNSMKINKNLIKTEQLSKSVTNTQKYLKDSVEIMKNKRIRGLNKDKNQKINKRRGTKTKAKKIGKGKLPSE